MSNELKACECGWKWPMESVDGAHHYVACWQCGRRGPWRRTESEAIAAWNRRVVTREQVDQMARALAGGRATAEDTCEARFNAVAMLRAAGFEVAE